MDDERLGRRVDAGLGTARGACYTRVIDGEEHVHRIRIVRLIGGQRHEIELPASEARELGIEPEPRGPVSVAYLMDGVFAWHHVDGPSVDQCPACGTTHRDVLLRHRVGCSQCYEVFARTIERLLRVRHEDSQHTGRIPGRLLRYRRVFVERENLLARLSVAIENEDFESAARIRDQIRALGEDERAGEDDGAGDDNRRTAELEPGSDADA